MDRSYALGPPPDRKGFSTSVPSPVSSQFCQRLLRDGNGVDTKSTAQIAQCGAVPWLRGGLDRLSTASSKRRPGPHLLPRGC